MTAGQEEGGPSAGDQNNNLHKWSFLELQKYKKIQAGAVDLHSGKENAFTERPWRHLKGFKSC